MKTYVPKPVIAITLSFLLASGVFIGLGVSGTFSAPPKVGVTLCGNGSVPAACYTPPTSIVASNGSVELIDASGCTDGNDATVGLYNWLNSLPQGTPAGPTIIDFPQTACYLVNGSIFLWGFQNFQFNYGEFIQKTAGLGNLTCIASTTGCYQANAAGVTLTGGTNVATSASGFVNVYVGTPVQAVFSPNKLPFGTTVTSLTCVPGAGTCNGSGTNCDPTDITGPLCTGITMSANANANGSVSLQFGEWSNPYGAAGTPTGGGQVLCNNAGSANGSSPYTVPTYASAPGVAGDLMWFVDGGCNIVFNHMVIIGANQLGGGGGASGSIVNTFITFAGTKYAAVTNVQMDGPSGDCVDSNGLHDQTMGAGFGYPSMNITAEYDLCVNAGRDDMSVGYGSHITYDYNKLYMAADDIFDLEIDSACQTPGATVGYGEQDNVDLSYNTIGPSLEGGNSDILTSGTGAVLANIALTNNAITGQGRVYISGPTTNVTFPTVFTSAATTTNMSPTITTTGGGFAGAVVGETVTGTGIPIGDTILTVNSANSLTLVSKATASGTPTVSFSNPNGCPDDPGQTHSSFTIADNKYTVANGASGGSPFVSDIGGTPLYVYGNKGPNFSSGTDYVYAPEVPTDPVCTANSNCPSNMTTYVTGNVITAGCGSGTTATCTIVSGPNSANCGNADSTVDLNAGTYLDSANGVPPCSPGPWTTPTLPTLALLPGAGAFIPYVPAPVVYSIGTLPCTPGYTGTLACVT
jgi:hypothetical protein